MANSRTDICNIALNELAADQIADFAEKTKNAVACQLQYDRVRDLVLRSHRWNVATRRAILPADAATPLFGFGYQYTLPADPHCLRVIEVAERPDAIYRIEGRKILTDIAAPLSLRYIARVDDPGLYDADLTHILALRLAAAIAFRVTNSKSLQLQKLQEFKDALREARGTDAMEDGPDEDEPSSLELVRYA